MTASESHLIRLLRFLGKVKFTLVLLLGGAVIMGAGTVLESRTSRDAAWSAIYGTPWFDGFLLLIGVNLVAAVINRIPIRRHQWPFVLTHFAIVLLLAGAWISRSFGYEGRMVIFEGEEQSSLLLDSPEIRTRWLAAADPREAIEAAFPLPPNANVAGRILRAERDGQPGIRIVEHVPDGVASFELARGGSEDAPGIHFSVSGAGIHVERWLIAEDPRFWRVDVGPVEVAFQVLKTEAPDRGRGPVEEVAGGRAHAPARSAKPRLVILLGDGERLRVQLATAMGAGPSVPIALGRTVGLTALGLSLEVQHLVPHARPEIAVQASPAGRDGGRSYVRIEASLAGKTESLWLARGSSQTWALEDGRALEATFGSQTRSVPFSIALREFELIPYPGSRRPAEYRSHVRVTPAAAGAPPQEVVISMNRPLDVAGFRLFQSSYQLGEKDEADATVLSVAFDPGVPIVYAAFALLILGIAWGLRTPRRHALRTVSAPDRGGAEPVAPISELPLPVDEAAHAGAGGGGAGLRFTLALALVAGLTAATGVRAEPAGASAVQLPVAETRGWAILADGRVKPLLTYANETVLALTGRESFDGLSSLEILWGYALAPEDFKGRAYIRIDSRDLKAKIGLDPDRKRVGFDALVDNRAFQVLIRKALRHEREGHDLERMEEDALGAYAKLDRVAGLISGEALAIVPIRDETGGWSTPGRLANSRGPSQRAIYAGFAALAAAHGAGDPDAFRREARKLTTALRSADAAVYPAASQIRRELFHQDFNAFGKAWKLYLAGFLAIVLLGFSERPWGYTAGLVLIGGGFVCHSIGLGTRWAIAGRAPVSDMYESLVFMGWGAIALGGVFESVQRKRVLAPAAGLMGFVCLVFAENLPIDSAINPLVPVLANTSWLAVHVMTIMLSYSALALAMVLGHAMLFIDVFRSGNAATLSSLSKLVYKTLQVGVLFLAAGIIFGAIWANESWGRYWGWDPKETWSLITFFVYLAIIHARFAGWLRAFGLAASCVVGFLAVVMTYYGVNFILASGMHAYGFSEGGQLYVAIYAMAEIAIIVAVYLLRNTASRPVQSDRVEAIGGIRT